MFDDFIKLHDGATIINDTFLHKPRAMNREPMNFGVYLTLEKPVLLS